MVTGGAIGSVFDGTGWRYRLLEFANDFRMVCLGISFGDQIQFFRRKPVIQTKLFPNIPLMEDVEFSIRLHRLGRQVYLFGDATVSTRKWQAKGFGHASMVIRLFASYLWKRMWGKPDTFKMYRAYYGKNASG
jgi:GT2 family glycosyltransferase